MACKRSGVRIPIAPPQVERINSNTKPVKLSASEGRIEGQPRSAIRCLSCRYIRAGSRGSLMIALLAARRSRVYRRVVGRDSAVLRGRAGELVTVGMPVFGVVAGGGEWLPAGADARACATSCPPVAPPGGEGTAPDGALRRRLSAGRRRPPGGWPFLGPLLCAIKGIGPGGHHAFAMSADAAKRAVSGRATDGGPENLAAWPGAIGPAGPSTRCPGRQRAELSTTPGSSR